MCAPGGGGDGGIWVAETTGISELSGSGGAVHASEWRGVCGRVGREECLRSGGTCHHRMVGVL